MKILLFANLHTPCVDKILSTDFSAYQYDICFTLGDIFFETLSVIQNCVKCSIYAVLGNHDEPNILANLDIKSIDRKRIELDGTSFAGLSGSSRYKSDNKPMLTQNESIKICKGIETADILISHDCAFGLYGSKSDKAHCGLKGISKYIKRNSPLFNIHGRYHRNEIRQYKHTLSICVYGCAILDINLKQHFVKIKNIFR